MRYVKLATPFSNTGLLLAAFAATTSLWAISANAQVNLNTLRAWGLDLVPRPVGDFRLF